MLNYLWEYHRAKIYAFAGVALFLISGALAFSLYPPRQEDAPHVRREQAEPPGNVAEHIAEPQPRLRAPAVHGAPAISPRVPGKDDGGVTVHIVGRVRRPGVYRLPSDSRVERLIAAAGGFDAFADENAVNMAELLYNGAFIEIPYKWQTSGRGSAPGGASTSRSTGKSVAPSKRRDERVDINSADEKTLTLLRGIGPALARRIVEYRREHGPFRSVDELVNVRGIGPAKVYGMRGQAFASP